MIYLTNGNMPLNAAYADEIVQEDNSTYQLTFRFPTSDSLWENLKEETFLTADDLHGEQDFVIFEVEKKHGYIQVYAKQVFTLLNNYVVSSLTLDRATGSTALSRFAGAITRDNPFSFFSDIEDRHTFNIGSKNAMEAFAKDKHSIIGQWGGDLVRHGYQVILLKNGGSENESLFMYKKNLSSYQHKTSTKSLKTRITFIATVKGEGEKAPDRKLSVVVDSPLINKYSQIYEDVIEVNDRDVKDEASLRKYGEQYYRTSLCDMMEDSLELEVVDQSDVPVQMFDIVSLFHDVYNLDVRKKITKYTYSPMGKKLKTIGFGQFKSGLANAIGNAVSDAVKGEAQQLQDDFERQLARELKNADLAFDRKTEELKNEFEDGLNATRAKAEEVKQELSDTIDQRFNSFNNGPLQEAKRRAEEALKKSGANAILAQEAKTVADQASAKMNQFKQESSKAQRDLSENVNRFKSELQQSLAGKADNVTVEQTERALRQKFESLSTDTIGKINAAKTEFEKTAQGLSTKITNVETYVNNDGQRQDDLKRYAREESASQARAVREDVTRDFVGKNTFQESVQGVERRLESLSLGTSGNLLKNSNDGFYNQHDKRYRLVETLQENQTYTLVTKYWHGENATGHTFLDGIGNWRRLTYNRAIDAWMVQFTPTQEIPAGTEITLSSDPYESKGNMHWATLVRGAIPLIHWQPARGDVEEGITQKLAEYKETVDGRFATISSQVNGKANQIDFQRVKETSQLYERILGGSGSSDQTVKDNIARLVMTNQLFQTEVSKYGQGGPNLIKNSGNPSDSSNWGYWEPGQNPTVRVGTHPFFYNQKRNLFFFDNNTRGGIPTSTIRFPLKRNTNYTLSLTAFNTLNIKGTSIFFLGRKTGETQTFTRAVTLVENVKFSTAEAVRKNYTFNSGECDEGFIRIDNNGTTNGDVAILLFGDVDVYEGTTIRPWQPSPEDTNEAVRTVQTQLAGSWAVQNINSAGDIISGINLGANGHNRITGKLTHITGDTLIDNAVIKSAMIDKLKTANFEAGSVTTTILDAEAVTADKVKMNEAFANKLVASDTFTNTLTAKRGFINQLVSNNTFTDGLTAQRGFIQKLISNDIFTNDLAAKRGFINQLQSKIINTETLDAFRGRIGGFNLGPFPQGGGRWIAGNNPYICGMGNGEGGGIRTAFWANWGNNWNQAGWGSWVVTTDGKMSCKNDVSFYHKADFSNTCTVNFYSKINALQGIWTGNGEINGNGSNPGGGQNAVVWWNQITTGKWRQHAGITTASDRRLKENIESTPVKALDKIKDLNLVAFDYIKDKSHEEIGLIAQEVLDIVPNAVSEYEGEDSHLTINYAKFIPYLLKAIQELNQKIKLMEERYGSII
ncbi:phage tail spike protein [Streptococcus mitis]|uniref:phage tail spike protein n=1 Tax=Streptococcus mitis TaxID=28037 RepID=UPI002001D7EC|nr:phage tail spike protein [Streptococcus mitis]